jgi:hypothetical protein
LKSLKTVLIFLALVLTISVATAQTDTGTSTVKLCSNHVCNVGGNGKVIVLTNHNDAVNPSYAQLLTFLRADRTDEIPYRSSFVCSDFARRLHDNAEAAGIKAGWVGSDSCNHAFNIFRTRDKGIVYIDCTGVPGGRTLQDKILTVRQGQPLIAKYLFRNNYGTMSFGCRVGTLDVYW